MENKQFKWVSALTPIVPKCVFFLLLTGLFPISVQAQNVSKYYTSLLQEENTLYFILPQDGFHNKERNSQFEYDITYSTKMDSVTLNFSYYDKEEADFDGIELKFQDKRVSNSLDRIFVEAEKKQWHYRYTTRLSLKDIEHFFATAKSPQIILNKANKTIELFVKPKKWEKQRLIINKILKLIRLNQNK